MLRSVLLASAIVMAAGAASAETDVWTDPKGLFTIEKPKAWPVDDLSKPERRYREFVTGTADEECWITEFPRPETVSAPVDRLIAAYSQPIEDASWAGFARGQSMFNGTEPAVADSAADPADGFPILTATLTHPERGPVIAAIHARPGYEISVFCLSYDGKDHAAQFRAVAKSLRFVQDAEWLASIPVAPAAPAASPPPAP